MTASDEVARVADLLAHALDAASGGAHEWYVQTGALDANLYLVERGWRRRVAGLRAAADGVELRTPRAGATDCVEVFEQGELAQGQLAAIVERVMDNLATLTRWDLEVGRRFRLHEALRGLSIGTQVELKIIDEVKPSGLDMFGFVAVDGGAYLELFMDRPDDAQLLHGIGRYLVRAR
jgi:hypothetical protein